MIRSFLLALLFGVALLPGLASAADRSVLTVEGKIGVATGNSKRLSLSSEDIASLPVTQFRTHTPWTPESEFAGVRISDILDRAKASKDAAAIVTRTIDGYAVSIPIDLVRKYPVILAYEMNGKRLTSANKGPYWVMFPTDDFPELRSNKTNERSAWALKGLIVK